jgi:deaminated glutathione amidase
VARNLATATRLVSEAADAGARFVALPENFGFLSSDADVVHHAQSIDDGPFVAPLRNLARARTIYVLAGSVPERGPDAAHIYNTSVLIGPDGGSVAKYRKIHLFDVDLDDGTKLEESSTCAPGSELVTADIDGYCTGLSICYDLRFPELYRGLVSRGARVLTVPAAFTLHTGKDHWEMLLRARAIENQCYVVAPAQFGHHGGKRWSWGKAMVVDPWGTTLAVAPEGEGFVTARLSASSQDDVRRRLPALRHRKL